MVCLSLLAPFFSHIHGKRWMYDRPFRSPSTDGKRDRPYLTVLPLAEDLGITVDTSCAKTDAKCVKKVVENYTGDGNILICWEHGELTDIVEELGDDDAPTYPDDR